MKRRSLFSVLFGGAAALLPMKGAAKREPQFRNVTSAVSDTAILPRDFVPCVYSITINISGMTPGNAQYVANQMVTALRNSKMKIT